MARRRIIARALVLSILFGGAASSQPVEWPERWAAVLKDTDKLLVAGEPERVRRILTELVREIVEASRPSDQTDAVLAVALTQLAVAEDGIGHIEDAVWIWHMAQNIVRDIAARVDLGAYGERASCFGGTRRRRPSVVPRRLAVRRCLRSQNGASRIIQPGPDVLRLVGFSLFKSR
jgi:hypothetical protein